MAKRLKKQREEASSAAAAERFAPDPAWGLTEQQVAQRTEEGFVNRVSEQTGQTVGGIVRSNVLTYFNMIFFVLAAVLLWERSYNNLTFLGVVFSNTMIGIVQELRSKRALDRLKILSAPMVKVIRGGREQQVESEHLVLDDIVRFGAGDQICADAILREGTLRVNEALVTGEADEILKEPGDELLSGSFVVSGSALAQLETVGDECFAAKLAHSAKRIKKKQQPGMMKSLTRLIQIIGIIIIPFSILMFLNQRYLVGLSERVSVENTAAGIIGMIPEGLYLLTSVALAASTVRLARKKTLVHDMKCIETLARVDVICVDKTGTITEPGMQVRQIEPLGENKVEELERTLRDFTANMSADNETMKALQEGFRQPGAFRHANRVRGFSSETKCSCASFGEGEHWVLGAPELLCPEDEALHEKVAEHAARGERVLLLGLCPDEETLFAPGIPQKVEPRALVMLSNPIRAHARETFAYFVEQGVEIRVISGDNPLTASAAAQEAGIPGAERWVDASTLQDEAAIDAAARDYTVFGRVTPEKKRQLIEALKKAGHTVAMTGDGVNDVLALKNADCSIAMASGSEAAANVSDLVLLDSDFAGMPQVVAEGRRVINNIERSASLFLVKNIFSLLLSLISLVSTSLYPLKPVQLSLASTLMIGIPSFILALEPNEELVRGRFLRNVLLRAAPAGLTAVIVVEWSLLFASAFSIPSGQASTVAFYLFTAAAYLMLLRVCRPMTALHGVLFGLMGVAFVATVCIVPGFFHIEALNFGCILVLSVLLLLAIPIDRTLFLIFERISARFARHHAKKLGMEQ